MFKNITLLRHEVTVNEARMLALKVKEEILRNCFGKRKAMNDTISHVENSVQCQ